ncbi:MAG: hypothetical protein LAT67_11065 [Balneolales bacterium]|nr:hypothetical protein [Balneolales bacterium]
METRSTFKADSTVGEEQSYRYKSYTLRNFRKLPQIQALGEEAIFDMEVVGNVLPFKANNYVVEELIDWDNVPNDPIFKLTFPQKDMLKEHHFQEMARVLRSGADRAEIKKTADAIRLQLNPHPAGQVELNKPSLGCGDSLDGMQHKYRETVLFFPSQGQTCHAYCTFCFRWPQFVGMDELKFAMRESDALVAYLKEHPEVTDVLFTGGDPLIMKPKLLRSYIQPLLDADLPNLKTIRIGSKSLSYWPYKFTTDKDARETLDLFQDVVNSGIHLAIMGHFSHAVELSTKAVKQAIRNIRETGCEIRTQSPILAGINDTAEAWREMWQAQINQGLIPYYMFVVRDTGARHYFDIPLEKAHEIYSEAYRKLSGLGRTVRGPSMSCKPGKVHVIGITEIAGEKYFVLNMIQGRNPEWANRPFFAKYDPHAVWIDDLKPAFGEKKFFYEDELKSMEKEKVTSAISLS